MTDDEKKLEHFLKEKKKQYDKLFDLGNTLSTRLEKIEAIETVQQEINQVNQDLSEAMDEGEKQKLIQLKFTLQGKLAAAEKSLTPNILERTLKDPAKKALQKLSRT